MHEFIVCTAPRKSIEEEEEDALPLVVGRWQ